MATFGQIPSNTTFDYDSWNTWSPTWTNLGVGNGTVVARYVQVGKLVHWMVNLTFGSTTSISGAVSIDLPVNRRDDSHSGMGAIVNCVQIGVGHRGQGFCLYSGIDTCSLTVGKVDGTYMTFDNITATIPHTWSSTDQMRVDGWYEAA